MADFGLDFALGEMADAAALVLRDLREHGTTLCIIDHKVAFLAEFAHRLIALQNGNKIAEGSPQEVLADQSVITAYLGRQHVGA